MWNVAIAGSIVVAFTLEGSESDVTSTLDDLYNSMQDGSYVVNFNGYSLQTDGTLMVDGQEYNTVEVSWEILSGLLCHICAGKHCGTVPMLAE